MYVVIAPCPVAAPHGNIPPPTTSLLLAYLPDSEPLGWCSVRTKMFLTGRLQVSTVKEKIQAEKGFDAKALKLIYSGMPQT